MSKGRQPTPKKMTDIFLRAAPVLKKTVFSLLYFASAAVLLASVFVACSHASCSSPIVIITQRVARLKLPAANADDDVKTQKRARYPCTKLPHALLTSSCPLITQGRRGGLVRLTAAAPSVTTNNPSQFQAVSSAFVA
jgi:hypothetical protein